MSYTRLQKIKFSFAGVSLSFLLIVCVGELVMRGTYERPQPPYNNKQKDALLGWRIKPDYQFHSTEFPDIKGNHYQVNVNFEGHGFRKWNSTSYDSVVGKVLVAGDSYVECLEADDAKTFYKIFSDSVPISLYAYGCAGYGTVQECLLVEKYMDSIKPDWVVLEMCSNDYVDNYWGLEMYSEYKSSQTRPYVNLKGELVYHYPRPWFEYIKEYSLFLNFVLERSHQALVNLKFINAKPAEEVVEADKKVAIQMTELALLRLKKSVELRGAKLIVYILGNLSGQQNEMDAVVSICQKMKIETITGAVEEIEKREAKGEVMRAFDGYHFNHQGQKVMSDVLINYFRQYELSK